jgi:Putative zinc- or iron-chelating domain
MSDVPCNGCTACCRGHIVVLSDKDEANMPAYDWRQLGKHKVLNNKPNGDCAHVGPDGCTIYEKRPAVCRTYDCRKHFKSLTGNERRRFSKSVLGDEARKRLDTLDAGDLADFPDQRRPNSHNSRVRPLWKSASARSAI